MFKSLDASYALKNRMTLFLTCCLVQFWTRYMSFI